jgi:S-adenosylmethionine hydrolase
VSAADGRGSIFLLTDYGTADEFAGVVRAVVLHHAPGAPVVDLSHEVPPFDVRAGAHALRRAVPHLGPGVVMAVVDPGVAGGRRPVALTVGQRWGERPRALVGPDNGLLLWAAEFLGGVEAAVDLAPSRPSPSTFDGRDVFAPAAAALWLGASLHELGDAVDPGDLDRLATPYLEEIDGGVDAEVLWVDRFGNVQLAATAVELNDGALGAGTALQVETSSVISPLPASFVHAFADLEAGALGVVVDANGHLAVVVDRGSAATVLGVRAGDRVVVRKR